MKKNIITCLGAIALMAGLSSCEKTDGAIYTPEEDKISFSTTSTSLAIEDGNVALPVSRSLTHGELSVPLSLSAAGEGYDDVFSLAGPVTFSEGQAASFANIAVGDISTIDPSALSVTASGDDISVGLAFPFTVSIDSGYASLSDLSTVNVLASNVLDFGEPQGGALDSEEGWAGGETPLEVEIQKADGANVYKVVSPFGANSFAFMIMADGKTIVCPDQVIDNHPDYGAVTMSGVTGTYAETPDEGGVMHKVITLQVGAYTVSAGSFGEGTEIITLP